MSKIDNALDLQALQLGLRNHMIANSSQMATLYAAGRVVGENTEFTPPSDGSHWVRDTLLPNNERHVAFKMVEAIGRWQVDVVVRRGTSIDVANSLRQEIAQAFRPGEQVDYYPVVVGNKIHIDRTNRLGVVNFGTFGSLQEVWVAYGIDVSWRAYAT